MSNGQMDALRSYLKPTIETIEFNFSQHDENEPWPYPGTLDEAKGRLQGYRDIYRMLGGQQ